MTLQDTQVICSLNSIAIIDENPRAIHRDLLSSTESQLFNMNFTQYNRTSEQKQRMSATDVDMEVKVRFARLRFIFLMRWLNSLMGWIEPFQEEAAAAAAQAQAAAKQQALETAQNVKTIIAENPPKIKLDVELAAPTIIVPRISTSDEILLFDLG